MTRSKPPLSIRRRAHYSPMQSPWDYDIVAETADGLPWSGTMRDFLQRFPGGLREWREWRRKALLEEHFDITDGVMSNPNKVINVIPVPGFEKGAAAGGGQLRPPTETVREVYEYVVGLWAAGIAEWWREPLPSDQEIREMRRATLLLGRAMEEGAENDNPHAAFKAIKDRPWWHVIARRVFPGEPFALEVSKDLKQDMTTVRVMIGDHVLNLSSIGGEANPVFIENALREGMKTIAKMLNRESDRIQNLSRTIKGKDIAAVCEEALQDASGPVELPSEHFRIFQLLPLGEEFKVRVDLRPTHPHETNACLKREPTLLFCFADDRIPITSPGAYQAEKQELFSTVQHEMAHIMQRLVAIRTDQPFGGVGLSKRHVRTPPEGEAWKQPHSLLEAEFYPSVFQEEQRFRRVLEGLKPEQRWQRLEEMAGLREKPDPWDLKGTSWFLNRLRSDAPDKWREAMRHIMTQIADLLPPREMKAAQLVDWEKRASVLPEWVLKDEQSQMAKDYKDPLEIKESPIHGQGLFATAPFDKGDTICNALRHVRSTGIADFDLLQTRWGRKINHSEDPNARPKVDPETGDVLVVARRGIDENDEITVDYDEFGEAVGKVAEDIDPESRIEVSPGNLQTALSRRRLPLSEIVSFEPPSGRLADDVSLVDVHKRGLATEDGRPILLDAAAADALAAAQKELPEGVSIMVMDGFRSQEDQARIVREMAAKLKKSHPDDWVRLLTKYTGGPEELRKKPGPMDHRSGRAVDIKLVGSDGEEINLGGMSMDETDRLVHYEQKTPANRREVEVKKNREMLRKTLEEQGFKSNPDEWWHWGYEPPISTTAASMKHPGPSRGWKDPDIVTMPFMPVRKDQPPGFQEEWDLEKDVNYRWTEGGTFVSDLGLPVDDWDGSIVRDLAVARGWKIPLLEFLDNDKCVLGRMAEEINGGRRMRLGRLLERLMRAALNKEEQIALANVQKRNSIVPARSEWMLIVSAEPSDLRTISTGRGWTSCMTQGVSGRPKPAVETSIGARDMVAYAVNKEGDWLARVVLRFDGKGGWWPESRIYGQPSSIDFDQFRKAVITWLEKQDLMGRSGQYSPVFQGWSDTLHGDVPSPPDAAQIAVEQDIAQGPSEPERYKGVGRSFSPAGLYAVHIGVWPTEKPNRLLHENIIHRIVSEHPELELDSFEYAPASEWAPLLGYIHVKGPDGLRVLKSDPHFDMVRRMASAAPLSILRNHPQTKSIVRTVSPPLSKRAGRRPGVDKEFIWVWDDGIRQGFGRAHGGRLVVVPNVEDGKELPGVSHAIVMDDVGLSGDDSQRIHRGFVTYNTNGSVEVAMYGAPFSSLLQSAPRAYNVLEERFRLLPGSYKQVVLPMPRQSYKELLEHMPTGTIGDADDIEHQERQHYAV